MLKGNLEGYIEAFSRIFHDYFKEEIERLSIEGKESLIVDAEQFSKIDLDMMKFLEEQPTIAFWCASEALRRIDTAGEPLKYFRVNNLIGRSLKVSDIRVKHLNKLWQVEGIIRRTTDIYPIIVESVWQCVKCGAELHQKELESVYEIPKRRIKPPYECYADAGGCGRRTYKVLLKEKCKKLNFQKIEIQEKLEEAYNPKCLEILLVDDICGKINPGDKVRIVGILKSAPVSENSVSMKYVMVAIYVEAIEKTFEDIELTPSDIKEIEEMAKREDIYDLFIDSIAPSLYGMRDEKEAIMLQLFGGVPKMKKGTRIRGDIHILLVGDPATAKSQLLRYVCQLSPKGIYTSGKGVSTAGLTASVTKSTDFGEGKWILEAGALVLADMGFIAVDELDKMDKTERDALHQAMEQQIITIHKAGVNATLNARCSILAGCNPQLGRFDDYINPIDQIKILPTLLSRFDIIMFLRDKPDVEKDRAIARHILNLHTDEQFGEPPLSPEFIRKYVAYARSNIKPKLSPQAKKHLEDFYVEVRNKSPNGISLTRRYLEGLIRLAEASAKVRLSSVADVKDAERACRLMSKFLMLNVEGRWFVEEIETGISKSKHDKLKQIFGIIREYFRATKKCIVFEEIAKEAEEKYGISHDETEEIINKLRDRRDIYEPRYKCYAPLW